MERNWKLFKVTRVSAKTNTPYECLILDFNGYQKVIYYQNQAEKVIFDKFVGDPYEEKK